MKKINFPVQSLYRLPGSCPRGYPIPALQLGRSQGYGEKREKNRFFIDFYTQWCGPCLNMAENIFTLGSVGNFYNDHFVCLKIDAETGEGVELAKKYEVASFPTFVFVNPKTEKAIHISGSNQDRETFLFTGASALDPKKTSVYLMEQQKAGNTKPEFLLDYAYYAASRYNRTEKRKNVPNN